MDDEILNLRLLVSIAPELDISSDLWQSLYDYQKDGLRWLWDLHNKACGGILGVRMFLSHFTFGTSHVLLFPQDDMGLGKTIQCLAFLSALFLSKKIKCAVIVCPKSLISHWQTSAKRWCGIVGGDAGKR
jgi:DNA excision repair protein ERCC-6